jgi:acetamidase/formamidase
MDCKEFVAGTSLFLPVFVPGANFSAGDGHAVQGDGEVCLTALETCLKGTFELVLHKDLKLAMPRAITPTDYITIGLDPDLDDAARQALRAMIAWLVSLRGWTPSEAYVFCSLACDLHVTQLVDGNKGIHAMVNRELLRK